MRILAYVALAVLCTGCLTHPNRCQQPMPSDPATETFAPSLNIDLSQMTRTTDGVYEQDLVVGTGETLGSATLVQMNYSAYLPDGTLVDQTTQGPIILDLQAQAALGVTEGMIGMNVGGQRLLVVPSQLALGPCGKGTIPPNSTVVYKIELLAINP
jgi:FKBP-type peptidyl-prolyl cis-trans isomerase